MGGGYHARVLYLAPRPLQISLVSTARLTGGATSVQDLLEGALDTSASELLSCKDANPVKESHHGKTPSPTSTPQLPFKTPQIPSNRDHKALDRGTLGGLGKNLNFERSNVIIPARLQT